MLQMSTAFLNWTFGDFRRRRGGFEFSLVRVVFSDFYGLSSRVLRHLFRWRFDQYRMQQPFYGGLFNHDFTSLQLSHGFMAFFQGLIGHVLSGEVIENTTVSFSFLSGAEGRGHGAFREF